MRVEVRPSGPERPLGLLIRIADGGDESPPSAVVTAPAKWRTFSKYQCRDRALHLFAIGHLYAKDASTFDVQESLKLLAATYVAGGITSVREAIGGGMFALIVIDQINHKIHVLCDVLACMPLYYLREPNGFTISTNQIDLGDRCEIARDACIEYLTYGYLPFSPSIFAGIERLGPGQILTVDFRESVRANITAVELPFYPPLKERISDEREVCERLDAAFSRFFGRIGSEPIAAGLSGGYDSRLIAAYTRDHQRRLVTFGYPGTEEVEIAGRVAAALGHSTEVFDIPADAPSRFLDDFVGGMQTLDSFEMSQVFGILHRLMSSNPSRVIDGFLGGEVMGSHYYYSLLRGPESLVRVLAGMDRYLSPPRAASKYAEELSSAYGRRMSAERFGSTADDDYRFDARLTAMAEEQRSNCRTDADMLELLSYRIRTRCVISCGPVSFLRRVPVLCPFYDDDVFRTCLAVDKSLRAGDRLYNAFWRNRFPELAHIPKESTGGMPRQGPMSYRLTHFKNAIRRRIGTRLGGRHKKAGGDVTDFVSMFCMCEENQVRFREGMQSASHALAAMGIGSFRDAHRDDSPVQKRQSLRLSALGVLLSSLSQYRSGWQDNLLDSVW